jgi:protein-disulfide isomerase
MFSLATIGRAWLAAAALALASPVSAQAPAATSAPTTVFNDAQKAAIRELVKDFLLKNPEVVQEALVELERRQKENEQQARLKITQDKNGPLYTAKHNVSFGNPNGDVTIVEFFDYNCGFCKRGLADLQKLVTEDKNLRVITKDFPVLGPGSIEAATVALAAKQQLPTEKLWTFHQKLLASRGQVGKQQAMDAAKEAGADLARLTKDIDSPAVRSAIEENMQIADALGLTGTPTYIVGDDVVVGAVGYADLKNRIDNLRKCGRNAC